MGTTNLDALALDSDLTVAGTKLTASIAEINKAADADALAADGLLRLGVARATYDFAVHGGAIGAKSLGVTLPANAVIVGGLVDVVTTCATASNDAGTMALHVKSANDIVSAVAVSGEGDPWDAGIQAIVPKIDDVTTMIKLTQAGTITATIAGQAFTAGKFHVYLFYLVSDATTA